VARLLPAILAAVFLLTAGEAYAAGPKMTPAAKKLLDRGLELYEKGSYDEASKALREGLALEPHPDFYYALGQSERRAGRCKEADDAYTAFLASKPPEREAKLARMNRTRCEPAAKPPEPKPEPPPTVPPPAAPPPAADASTEGDSTKSSWAKDGAFIALLTGGSVTVVFGAVALGIGEKTARDAETAPTLGEFRDAGPESEAWRIAGGVSIGVGAALLAGSIARAVVVAERADSSTALFIGPGRAGIRGSF
jgi:tetratricopeptide (TPR) repeat protein